MPVVYEAPSLNSSLAMCGHLKSSKKSKGSKLSIRVSGTRPASKSSEAVA